MAPGRRERWIDNPVNRNAACGLAARTGCVKGTRRFAAHPRGAVKRRPRAELPHRDDGGTLPREAPGVRTFSSRRSCPLSSAISRRILPCCRGESKRNSTPKPRRPRSRRQATTALMPMPKNACGGTSLNSKRVPTGRGSSLKMNAPPSLMSSVMSVTLTLPELVADLEGHAEASRSAARESHVPSAREVEERGARLQAP